MTIRTCQENAKAQPAKVFFDIVTPKGTVLAQWVDPWLGMFIMDGALTMTSELQFLYDCACYNLRVKEK